MNVTHLESIVVQLPDAGRGRAPDGAGRGKPRTLSLGPGQVATFGRGAPGSPVDIALPGKGVSRLAGRIEAAGDYWRVSNFSRAATYVVESLEGGGEYLKVAPGRLGAPVPFELSRVVLPLPGCFARFTVFAPCHLFQDRGAAEDGGSHTPDDGGDHTTPAFAPLDPTAKYFLVLLALCEPRLRDPASLAIPAAPEVAARLRPMPGCADLTPAAVGFHVDYLADTKLRVRERAGALDLERMEWKREALVNLALRFNLVQDEDLARLPGRRTGAGR